MVVRGMRAACLESIFYDLCRHAFPLAPLLRQGAGESEGRCGGDWGWAAYASGRRLASLQVL
jgi:hypothetical protein